jgi:hypothetical protein
MRASKWSEKAKTNKQTNKQAQKKANKRTNWILCSNEKNEKQTATILYL